jgi:hypothetical protein
MRHSIRFGSSLAFVSAALLFACNGGGTTTDAADGGSDATMMGDASDVPNDTASDVVDEQTGPLPDLTIDPDFLAQNVQFTMQYFNPSACELAERCVSAPGWRRLLMFTTFTPNIGDADLNLGMSAAGNPNFEYSECHHHYHFRGYADYSLLGGDGGLAAIGHKQSFCVEDLEQVDTGPGIRTDPYYDACGEGGGRQGISRGWADDYYPNLPCQWIDVTDVPPGNYTLRVALNTEHRFAESDYTNNSAEVPVTIPAAWNTRNPLQACTHSSAYQGVGRDCGWSLAGSFGCTPGDTVSVGCNAACGLGTCEGSWDLRICDGDNVCQGGDAMHLLQQDSGACSTGVFDLASTCPVATFTCPASGRYTVMSAADYDGDTQSSCHLETRVTPAGDGGVSDGGAGDGSVSDAGSDDASSDASPADAGD